MKSYNSLKLFAKEYAEELKKNHIFHNVVIEIGNSCRVMHLGAVRQLYLAFKLREILGNYLPKDIKVQVHYYESDGLPPLLNSSRGITLNGEVKKIFFSFGLNKKIPVIYQKIPSLDNLQKTSDSIRSFLLASSNLRAKYSKNELSNSILEMQSFLMNDFDKYKGELYLWYRGINDRILNQLDIPSPIWKNNSLIIQNSNTKEEKNLILDTINLIKSKLNYWPIWIFDSKNRSRKRVSEELNIFELLSNKEIKIYPDVILRQALSCRKYPVINIHGNNYDYQLKIDQIIKEMNISKRIIYNAQVTSITDTINPLGSSIDWFNILLDKKYNQYKNILKEEDLFLPIKI